jgi:hypothetical protein
LRLVDRNDFLVPAALMARRKHRAPATAVKGFILALVQKIGTVNLLTLGDGADWDATVVT